MQIILEQNSDALRAVVLNLWVATLCICVCWGGGSFHRGHLRPLENMGIYMTVHNSSKIVLLT